MAFMAGNITALLSIKIKARHDDYTDQVSRICVVKILIVSSLVMGVDFFHDTISCLPPTHSNAASNIPHKFIQSSCWIKGFYVHPDLPTSHSFYYGIPANIAMDGLSTSTGDICKTTSVYPKKNKETHCVPMKKRYMKQYQWMPFWIASMALLFYLPYIIFRVVNTDMISLRANINDQVDRDKIVQNYFNYAINSVPKMRMRVFMNVIIKLLYVCVNVAMFLVLDNALDNTFMSYGSAWIQWSRLNSTMQLELESRDKPTPGNRLLPSFGICSIGDTRTDVLRTYQNKVTMVCEISSHVLYQYFFLILWFVLVASLTVAILGVLLNILGHINNTKFSKSRDSSKVIYQFLTIRECEYLEFIRRRNLALYGSVLTKLRHSKTIIKDNNNLPNGNGIMHHLDEEQSLRDEKGL